jgi:hypothetical protein
MEFERSTESLGLFVPRAPAIIRVPKIKRQLIAVSGRYDWTHLRDGQIIDEGFDENLVVNEGLNDVLSVYLVAGTQKPSWFLGVFEGNYTPVATDTAAVITANSTECVAYTASTRQAWTPGAVAAQAVDNSASRASFTFNATKTIYGAFLISYNTKSGTTGTLFSAARFATSKAVANLDQLLLTYSFTASSV